MRDSTLLVIEGKHADHPAFVPSLRKKGFVVEQVTNGSEALARLAAGLNPDVVVVNAASLRTSGKRICKSLRDKASKLPILLILDPDQEIEKVDADVLLSLPFTAQKLVNRIRHLLPGNDGDNIHAGPVRLDMEKRIVRCQGTGSATFCREMTATTFTPGRSGWIWKSASSAARASRHV